MAPSRSREWRGRTRSRSWDGARRQPSPTDAYGSTYRRSRSCDAQRSSDQSIARSTQSSSREWRRGTSTRSRSRSPGRTQRSRSHSRHSRPSWQSRPQDGRVAWSATQEGRSTSLERTEPNVEKSRSYQEQLSLKAELGAAPARPEIETCTSWLVEEFLRARRIDQIAGDTFRRCRREVQLAVIARGALVEGRHASTALFTRIRNVEAVPQDSSKYVHEEQAVAFMKKWDLDPDAQSRMLCLSPDVQLIVMKEFNPPNDGYKGGVNGKFVLFASSLHTAEISGNFNPKMVLEGGMKSAEFFKVREAPVTLSAASLRPEVNAQTVEDFIMTSGVDSDTAAILRNCPLSTQFEVVKKGKLKCALSSPSAALCARIKSIQGSLSSADPGAPSPVPPTLQHGQTLQPELRQCSPPQPNMQISNSDGEQSARQSEENALAESLERSLSEALAKPQLPSAFIQNLPAAFAKRIRPSA